MDKHSFSTNKLKQIFKPARKPINWFRETRLRNKIFVVIAVLLVGFFIFRNIQSSNAQPEFITESVSRDTITEIVSETGNVSTGGKVDITSSATGIVEEIYVQNGDPVEVGTELFKVKSTATEQEKATAWAAYQNTFSAQKTAEQNKQTLDATMWTAQKTLLDAREAKRVKDDNKDDYEDLEEQSLDAAHVQAEKNFTAAEQKYKEADVSVNAAKAQVNSAWLAYQATQNAVVKATATGTVANLSISVGDKATAGAGNAGVSSLALAAAPPPSPVLSIISGQESFTVKLSLNEVDVPKVRSGQRAQIFLDAFADKTFDGRISNVDEIGTNNQGVVTYNVYVTILNFDNRIKPAMTANVDIEVDQAKNVLTVPNSAIKPYKGGKAVQIYDVQSKEPKFIPIKIGVRGIDKTEVLEGVAEGVEVITALQNGQVKRSGSTILGGGQ